jgi:hypothetical protein
MNSGFIYRIFYTNQCKECIKLLELIHKDEEMKKWFNYKCLDNMTAKQLEKIELKHAPSIVISSNNSNTVYEGARECSKWFNNFTKNRATYQMKQVEARRRMNAKKNLEEKRNGFLEYNEEEMEGMADTYSYVNTDMPQIKNYIPVGQEDNFKILTINDKGSKMSKRDTDNQISNIRTERTSEVKNIQQILERQQISAVMNANGHN